MPKENLFCPSCGAPHELPQPLPITMECFNCKSGFSPADELHRYTIYICKPDPSNAFFEIHKSGHCFILPRKGDKILSQYENLSEDESLRVLDIEFKFVTIGNTSRQEVYIHTEVVKP